MIHRKPKTAKGYLHYHRLMWGRIVKEMEKGEIFNNRLKRRVFRSLFSFRLPKDSNYCFCCGWLRKVEYSCRRNRLLDFKGDDCCKYFNIATGETKGRIEAAKKIRDLDMKEKWK